MPVGAPRFALLQFAHGRRVLLRSSRTDVYALRLLGAVAMSRGDFDEARRRDEESLALMKQRGDFATVAAALADLGKLERLSGNYPRSRDALEEALALARDLDDNDRVADVLTNLSHLAPIADDAPTVRSLAEALDLYRMLGSRHLPTWWTTQVAAAGSGVESADG